MKRTSETRAKRAARRDRAVRPDTIASRQTTDGTPPESARGRLGLGRLAVVFALLYGVTFPWYLRRDWIDPTLWAFPAWGVVTAAGSVAIGAFTAWIYLFSWPEAPPPDADPKP